MQSAPADPTVLARFRPTWRQALGHGLFVGALVGCALAAVAAVVTALPGAIDAGQDRTGVRMPWWGWVALAAVPLAVGGLAGLVRGRASGVDIDALGVHRIPRTPRSFGPWQRIVDIREERARSRTVVAIYLDSGARLQLPAPYDARGLGGDPEFERKMFTLRNLWDNHRSWPPRP